MITTIRSLLKDRSTEYKALIALYLLGFFVTTFYGVYNVLRGSYVLGYIECAFALISIAAIYRLIYKQINFRLYSIAYLLFLMILLLFASIKMSTSTAVIFYTFLPFSTVILLHRRTSLIWNNVFLLLLTVIYFLDISTLHYTYMEFASIIIGMVVYSEVFAFYVNAVREAQKLIQIKDHSIQEKESRFQMVTDIAFEALIITQNAVIIQGNDKAVEMFGYKTQSDILNKHLQIFVTPASMQKIAQRIQNNDESAYAIEGIKGDGTIFPAQVRGKNVSYMGVNYRVSAIEDLSNLQEAQDEIAKLGSAIEQSSQMIFITDVRGHIEYVNRSFEEKTGFSAQEVIGQTPKILKSNQHDAAFYQQMWSTIKSGAAWSGEMFNHRKDGSTVIVQNFINSIKDKKGDITHFISTQEDITQQKEQEKIVLSQMKQAQMGEMLSMIAHQWRQPLSAISTISANVQLGLQLETMEETEIMEFLHLIDEHVFFLSDTIDDFRNFFQPDKSRSISSVGTMMDKVLNIISKQLEMHGIRIMLCNESNPELFTYINEVIQVILSLLNNIIDKVKDENLVNQKVDIDVLEDDDNIYLLIQDHAGGIPENIINEIFIPYFSTKKEKQGTGLGLYMSKTIIEDHCSGKIEVFNQNGGACFKIRLPKSEGKVLNS